MGIEQWIAAGESYLIPDMHAAAKVVEVFQNDPASSSIAASTLLQVPLPRMRRQVEKVDS